MERLMSMLLVGVVAAVMLKCATAQTVHVVGDNIGWTIPSNGTEGYITWASSKTFLIGDTLIFNFATNAHDVVQVPKASYDTCSDDDEIGNPITTGPANVTLTSAGDHYYICTFGSHCQAGQKLAITVSATPGVAPPPTTPSTPTTPATPSPTSSTAPEACPPEAPTPKADGPTATSRPEVVPPPPDYSSSTVFAAFSLTALGFAVGLFL